MLWLSLTIILAYLFRVAEVHVDLFEPFLRLLKLIGAKEPLCSLVVMHVYCPSPTTEACSCVLKLQLTSGEVLLEVSAKTDVFEALHGIVEQSSKANHADDESSSFGSHVETRCN